MTIFIYLRTTPMRLCFVKNENFFLKYSYAEATASEKWLVTNCCLNGFLLFYNLSISQNHLY